MPRLKHTEHLSPPARTAAPTRIWSGVVVFILKIHRPLATPTLGCVCVRLLVDISGEKELKKWEESEQSIEMRGRRFMDAE